MSRKVFVFICLLLAVFLPAVFAEAQQPKKVPRIGYLSATAPARETARAEGIRLALSELGYIEGQNIAIEYRYAGVSAIGSVSLQPNWCVSRSISFW